METYTRQHTVYPDEFPESWASGWGEDEFGLWMEFTYKGVSQKFRWCEPGTFWMGSPEDELDRESNGADETQHPVTLSQGYWIADTTCTQALWQSVMGNNPSQFKGESNPVERVSWNDTQKFLDQLNKQQPDLNLRLPTEAEWENACRAGTTTSFHFGGKGDLNLEKVNYSGEWDNHNFDGKTQLVTNYPANLWGLYQMHGNVLEWCQDFYKQYPVVSATYLHEARDYRMLRGGSWVNGGRGCRSAYRNRRRAGDRSNSIGFRLVCGL